jgi:hypothetical protein
LTVNSRAALKRSQELVLVRLMNVSCRKFFHAFDVLLCKIEIQSGNVALSWSIRRVPMIEATRSGRLHLWREKFESAAV